MSYETIQAICGTVGLLTFCGIFAAVVAWTFRPGSTDLYKTMANMPLRKE